MIHPRTAKRLALSHCIVSILLMYFRLALALPGRPEPTMIASGVGAVWAVLNPPVFFLREAFDRITGQPLAFFAVLALQVVWSYCVFVILLWFIDKHTARTEAQSSS